MKATIATNKRLNFPTTSITSKIIDRKFGRPEDYIEAHIYNENNQLLTSIEDFTDYSKPEDLSTELNMDPVTLLNDNGYNTGRYKLVFNILRKKIFNTSSKKFILKAISSSRTELRVIAKEIPNAELKRASQRFINEISNSPFLRDFILNFGNNNIVLGVNIIFNNIPTTNELIIKLSEPLPNNISLLDNFSIAEEITSPLIINQDLGIPEFLDDSISLKGPNFKIDTRINNSIPSDYQNYDEILSYQNQTSYQILLNKLENKEIPEIQYDFIRTPSGSNEGNPLEVTFHFENFVHFGSALERIKNFKYKIELLEYYDKQLDTGYFSSPSTQNESLNILNKKTNLIKGFDGYESFLYNETGSLSWPKSTTTSPYKLYSVSSSQVKTWLGDERSTFSNYGGQLLSASLYDGQNEHSLIRLIPSHILDNPNNSFYITFVNMMGHHYDQIWTYIKHITEVNDTHHIRGISKDLVYYSLKSLGLETFDQFENSTLIDYILGGEYTNPNLVSASNSQGLTPKEDISKEIWKRLYHNAPYLLKTKGTERGLKALMSCYGIPSTILNIKEYGGSTSDKTTYQTFSYEKSGLALKGDSGTGGYFIKTLWSSSLTDDLNSTTKTVEFRIKPHRSNDNYHLWSLSGSVGSGVSQNNRDQHLILEPYTGNDISSSGDANQYGRITFQRGASAVGSTQYFPVYNGDFWNIFISPDSFSSLTSQTNINFGAYQSNHLKNTNYYITSSQIQGNGIAFAWGLVTDSDPAIDDYKKGASYCYIGGLPEGGNHTSVTSLRYSGSIQEVRYHFGESLSNDTLIKHALEPFMYSGNTPSSSYENLVLRLPLGSNDQKDISSFHPNIGVNYLGSPESSMSFQTWEEVIETHHLPTPDTVGISMTSEKVRLDTGTVDDNWLSYNKKGETSTLDRQPLDYPDLGVFFSPTTEINEDILYTLGSFRLDDYIGSPLPSAQIASIYEDLSDIKNIYFKKVNKRYNYWDYIYLIQQIDHTLFKLIEQFVPSKANLKSGLVIEPHYLERTKFKRELPTIGMGQSMKTNSYQTFETQIDPEKQFSLTNSSVIVTNNLLQTTGSNQQRKEQGTNATLNIKEQYSLAGTSDFSGNFTNGITSNRYYRLRRLIN